MRIISQLFTDNFESFDWLTADSDVFSQDPVAGTSQRPNGDHSDSSEPGIGGVR
jgi:hypothetical protein